jgi:uncharacterized protein (TIGR00290 family)
MLAACGTLRGGGSVGPPRAFRGLACWCTLPGRLRLGSRAMTSHTKTLLSWSSGKDSAWALHVLRQQPDIEVVGLLTTVSAAYERVTMHVVGIKLLRAQAKALGLGLIEVRIPHPCPEPEYATAMREALTKAGQDVVTAIAFGDLFLEDVRCYREDRMRGTGLRPLFPLWGLPTPALARDMMAAGLRARIVCVDPSCLDAEFAGRAWNASFLADLPSEVDPCGERGEFHTFAYDGPMFDHPIPVRAGEVVRRDGFVFADVELAAGAAHASPSSHAP